MSNRIAVGIERRGRKKDAMRTYHPSIKHDMHGATQEGLELLARLAQCVEHLEFSRVAVGDELARAHFDRHALQRALQHAHREVQVRVHAAAEGECWCGFG